MSTRSVGKMMRQDAVQNRERVLTAAEEVFGAHGVDAPMNEVADAARVGVGTVYRHFPNKQALIDEIIGARRRQLVALADAADSQPGGMAFEWLLVQVGHLQSEQSGCLERLWDHSEAELASLDDFRRRLAMLLTDAQQAGRIRTDATPTDVSMIFWSVREVVRVTRSVAPNAWRRHLELQLAGLRPAGDAAPLNHPPLTDAQARRIMRATS